MREQLNGTATTVNHSCRGEWPTLWAGTVRTTLWVGYCTGNTESGFLCLLGAHVRILPLHGGHAGVQHLNGKKYFRRRYGATHKS